MEHEEIKTLEARRLLIWNSRREGYLLAIEDLDNAGHRASAELLMGRLTNANREMAKENARVS